MLAIYRSSNEEDNVNNLVIISSTKYNCRRIARDYFTKRKYKGFPIAYAFSGHN